MEHGEHHDRLMDALLSEVVGGETPPDLGPRVLPRATAPERRLRRVRLVVGVAAVVVLAVFAWRTARPGYPPPEAFGDFQVVGGGLLGRGSTVRTQDDLATLRLGGYCRVDLDANTVVRVEGSERAEQVVLLQGGVACEVDSEVGAFAVRTDVGTVSVAGTRFRLRLLGTEGGTEMKRLMVRVLAGVVLASGSWGQVSLQAGETKVLPPRAAEPDAPPVKPKYTPLPEGIQQFQGTLIGPIAAMDDRGLTLQVTKAVPAPGNKAKDPACVVGQSVRLVFYAFGNKEGGYTPDPDLVKAARQLREKGGPVTAKVMAERDEALIVRRLWAGAQPDPERPDPPPPPRDPRPDPPRPERDPRPDPPRPKGDPRPDPPAKREKDTDF
jgi:hypothetical protein